MIAPVPVHCFSITFETVLAFAVPLRIPAGAPLHIPTIKVTPNQQCFLGSGEPASVRVSIRLFVRVFTLSNMNISATSYAAKLLRDDSVISIKIHPTSCLSLFSNYLQKIFYLLQNIY